MIMIVIGCVLVLFGIFVFFKKNEGETEISLLGAKVKSNNSAILLITLGAVIAAIGASAALDKDKVAQKEDPVNKQDSAIQKPADLPVTVVNSGINKDLMVGDWKLSQTLRGEDALLKIYGTRCAIP